MATQCPSSQWNEMAMSWHFIRRVVIVLMGSEAQELYPGVGITSSLTPNIT